MNSFELLVGPIAGVLILTSQFTYIRSIFLRKIKPSALSWLGWFFLMAVTVYSQIVDTGWNVSLLGISFATFGCGFICIASFSLKQYSLEKQDWYYLALGLLCVLFYVVFQNPWLTTWFGIIGDFVIGIPTIKKAYKEPKTEKTGAWYFSLSSWFLSLILSFRYNLIYSLFPLYLLAFNLIMIYLSNRKAATLKPA